MEGLAEKVCQREFLIGPIECKWNPILHEPEGAEAALCVAQPWSLDTFKGGDKLKLWMFLINRSGAQSCAFQSGCTDRVEHLILCPIWDIESEIPKLVLRTPPP